MKKLCDLHCHSVYSDGSLTPAELVEEAVRQGLTALALTDHDTTQGLAEFTAAAEGRLEAIRGVEVSTLYHGKIQHIHALFLPPEQDAALLAYMEEGNKRDREIERFVVDWINRKGYSVDYDTLMKDAPGSYVIPMTLHLRDCGYASETMEARLLLRKLVAETRAVRPPICRPDAVETVRFIRSLGAVPVWAHPFVTLSEEEIPGFLEQAVPAGLQGMEVFYYSYDEETTQKSLALADRFGLRYSGGSDFHGLLRPTVQIGCGKGELSLSYDLAAALKQPLA